METNITRGKKGEDLAAEFLEKKGYEIIEKNWRFSRVGEIDLIAKDGDCLVFTEVKARRSVNFGHPLESISQTKLNTIRKLAEIYINKLSENNYRNFRVDIVGVLLSKTPEIIHLEDVY